MEISLRRIQGTDAAMLLHVDRVASEFPWETSEWTCLENHYTDWADCVVLLDGELVGFAIFDFDKNIDSCRLFRFCILPQDDPQTYKKLSDAMMGRIEFRCFSRGIGTIEIDLCETECLGVADPYDRTVWLKDNEFKMAATDKDIEFRYNKTYDMYYFAKVVEDCKFI